MAAPKQDGLTDLPGLGLADALIRLTHVVRRAFADASRRHDLTPTQAELLCVLTAGPMRMIALGRAMDIEKSSLSGLVDRVEVRGLVTRVPTPEDRRGYHIELTRVGARTALACHAEVTRHLEALADDLPATERARLRATLNHLL
jgi:DNA-binding MarR family transcriptional regulator